MAEKGTFEGKPVSHDCCREGFKKLDILTVPRLHIYVLMLFVVKNPKIYQTNTSVHGRNTRQQNELHVPSVRSSTI
jgi:hypothetical protein